MRAYDLSRLIHDSSYLDAQISRLLSQGAICRQAPDRSEIEGHLQKAQDTLQFVKDNLELGHFDWCITGCYYASYHAVLSLIMTKGFSSKSHLATLCLLIKEHYPKEIQQSELEMIDALFIDYQDLVFYVESKNKRESATYSSRHVFDRAAVEESRIKAVLFVNKARTILEKKR